MDVSVIVATYGSNEWRTLATERAIPSARRQAHTLHIHGETLADARNKGLERTDSEFVIWLDADDELSENYIAAMAHGSKADLRVPMLRFMPRGNLWQPRVWRHRHDCVAECVTSGEGNWIPAGTVWRRQQVIDAGGWREWPMYEDFDLAMRVLQRGASIELVRDAIYIAWVRADSRNRGPSGEEKVNTHHEIVIANGCEQCVICSQPHGVGVAA